MIYAFLYHPQLHYTALEWWGEGWGDVYSIYVFLGSRSAVFSPIINIDRSTGRRGNVRRKKKTAISKPDATNCTLLMYQQKFICATRNSLCNGNICVGWFLDFSHHLGCFFFQDKKADEYASEVINIYVFVLMRHCLLFVNERNVYTSLLEK